MDGVAQLMPAVDVIMPVGPGPQPYLAEAVTSVLNSKDIDFRLTVVLDGRGEPPSELTDSLLDSRRLTVTLNRLERGVAGAMNTGVASTSEPLIAVMHADDVCHTDRLRQQVHALDLRPEIAVLGTRSVSPQEVQGVHLSAADPVVISRVEPMALLLENFLTDPTVMMRREAVLEVGGYSGGMTSMQDYELWLRLAAGHDLAILDLPLLGYRLHPGQFSRRSPKRSEWKRLHSARRALARARFGHSTFGSMCHSVDLARRVRLTAKRRSLALGW